MSKPYAPFLSYLASPWTLMLNRESVEERGDLVEHPGIGTGPVHLQDSWEKDVAIEMHANPNYWKKDQFGERPAVHRQLHPAHRSRHRGSLDAAHRRQHRRPHRRREPEGSHQRMPFRTTPTSTVPAPVLEASPHAPDHRGSALRVCSRRVAAGLRRQACSPGNRAGAQPAGRSSTSSTAETALSPTARSFRSTRRGLSPRTFRRAPSTTWPNAKALMDAAGNPVGQGSVHVGDRQHRVGPDRRGLQADALRDRRRRGAEPAWRPRRTTT